MSGVITLVAASGGLLSVLAGAEAISRRWRVSAETSRKLGHISAAVLASALPLIMSFGSVAILALVFLPVMAIIHCVDVSPTVDTVDRSTAGEIYFSLGVLVVAILVPHPAAYAYGMLVMGISDALASLAGDRWKYRPYRIFRAEKTVLGSSVFFVTTVLLTIIALAVMRGLTGPIILVAVMIACVLTLAEGALGGGVDNLILPALSAILIRMA